MTRFQMIDTNGVRLRVAVAGPEDGQLVLLVHGFHCVENRGTVRYLIPLFLEYFLECPAEKRFVIHDENSLGARCRLGMCSLTHVCAFHCSSPQVQYSCHISMGELILQP